MNKFKKFLITKKDIELRFFDEKQQTSKKELKPWTYYYCKKEDVPKNTANFLKINTCPICTELNKRKPLFINTRKEEENEKN